MLGPKEIKAPDVSTAITIGVLGESNSGILEIIPGQSGLGYPYLRHQKCFVVV